MSRYLEVAAVLWILILPVAPVSAHQQGSSYSQWQLAGDQIQSVTVKISALDLTRAAIHPASSNNDDITRYLQSRLLLEGCKPQHATVTNNSAGWYSVSWPWRCSAKVEPVITSNILAEVAPNHLHFARWLGVDGKPVDRLLNRGSRETRLTDKTSAVSSDIGAYFRLGVKHIVTGYDHLAFLLGLLLLATRKQLLWLITGFTVGHSITLALASSGWLRPNIGFIEAAIAWSIALLCAEILWRRSRNAWPWLLPMLLLALAMGSLPLILLFGFALFTVAYAIALKVANDIARRRLTAAITLAFGLIHGCGFAAILAESNSRDIALCALFGFNLGIEVGQLLLVAMVLPVAWLFRSHQLIIRQCSTYLLLALATYWWALRI